jgi:hypothetical protein
MCSDVLRLRSWSIVDITTDIEVVVFFLDIFQCYDVTVLVELFMMMIDVSYLFDIFGTEDILIFGFCIFAICIDEEVLVFHLWRFIFVDDKDTGRDSCTIEEFVRESDDCFEDIMLFSDEFSIFFFFSSAEQYSMRHDTGKFPVCF